METHQQLQLLLLMLMPLLLRLFVVRDLIPHAHCEPPSPLLLSPPSLVQAPCRLRVPPLLFGYRSKIN